MNKNISIALVTLLAFAGVTASAQTGVATSLDASVGTTSVGGASTGFTVTNTGTAPTGTITTTVKQEVRPDETRLQIEAREKMLREKAMTPKQTQGATFGEKAKAGAPIGDPDFDLLRKSQLNMQIQASGERKDMRIEIKDDRIKMETRARELHASTTAQQEKIKDKAQKKRLEMARKQVEIVDERLKKAIPRVQKLSDRVSEKLIKLEATGVDVTAPRQHLAMAKTKLDEARTKAAGVGLTIQMAFASITASVSTSTTPGATAQNAMKSVQEAVKDVAKTIQEAHNHVALAVSSIKPGINKGPSATTSATASGTVNAATTQ